MFIGCADADNARVICDLPATGIGDPNAGRARQNLRDGEGEADADDYLFCIHLPFIKADASLGRNRSYLPPGRITYCFQALMKTVWPAIQPSCCLTPMRGPCMEPSDSGPEVLGYSASSLDASSDAHSTATVTPLSGQQGGQPPG